MGLFWAAVKSDSGSWETGDQSHRRKWTSTVRIPWFEAPPGDDLLPMKDRFQVCMQLLVCWWLCNK